MLTIPEQSLFGLDISQSKLRLAQVQTHRRKKTITTLRELAVPDGVIVEGSVADVAALTQLVSAMYRGHHRGERPAGNGVISVLPESKTFIKLITIGGPASAPIVPLLEEEIPRHIPLPLEDLYYDWQAIGPATHGKQSILVGAAPRALVDSYLTVLRGAGLVPFALEIEAVAITRCLLPWEGISASESLMIIDIGAARTGLIVTRGGVIQFTVSLPISGVKITHQIAATLNISLAEAEQSKIVCGLDDERCRGALRRVLDGTLDELTRKIEAAISFYAENYAGHPPITALVLTGGGANFIHIERVLSEKLRLPVTIANPLTNVTLPNAHPQKGALQSHVTAIGLALRGTQHDGVI